MEDKRLPSLCSDETCTGCMACANACPVDAIQIVQNEEGFYRPMIISDKCIKCLKCEHACPVIESPDSHEEAEYVHAAWHKDDEIRRQSTSGGAFSALAETVIENGGVVAGVTFTRKTHVSHIIVENIPDLSRLRLSKYVQSDINFILREVKRHLDEGKEVLFSGTPCQVSGLRNFLNKEYHNLITCDFICHGVPSPALFDKYVNWLNKKYKGDITAINFRDKRKGWYDCLRVISLSGKPDRILKGLADSYWISYNNKNNLQKSCYSCRFLGEKRNSDITIADFWGVGKIFPFGHKKEISNGISMIMANTPTGKDLVFRSSGKMILIQRHVGEVIISNQSILHSSKMPDSRHDFYKDLHIMDYDVFRKKYIKPDFKTILVKCMRENFPSWFTKTIRLINQK